MNKPDPLIVPVQSRMFANGVKPSRACARAGITPQTWARWVRGNAPSVAKVRDLERAVEEILAEEQQAGGASETAEENA